MSTDTETPTANARLGLRPGEDPVVSAPSEELEGGAGLVRKAKTQTVNQRLLAEIEGELAAKGGVQVPQEPRPREEADLNGINPAMAFLGAGGAAAMSYGAWQATLFLTAAYYTHPIQSDIYFVQRISGVLKQVIVGLGSLATGIFGVTALGMLLLSLQVLVGVAKGELDMNAESNDLGRKTVAGGSGSDPEAAVGRASELVSRVEAEIQRDLQKK